MEDDDIAITDNPEKVVIDLINDNWDTYSTLPIPRCGEAGEIDLQAIRVITTKDNFMIVDNTGVKYDNDLLFEDEMDHTYNITINVVTRTRDRLISYFTDLINMLNILSNRPHSSLTWAVLYFRGLDDRSHDQINRFRYDLEFDLVSYTRAKPA